MTTEATARDLVVERTLELDHSPERVWRALTDPEELSSWFGDSAEVELEVGAEGWFGWEAYGRFPMRVVGLEPRRRLFVGKRAALV